MSFPIASLEFPPDWQGWYARKQQVPDDQMHLFAEEALNVEFYGSVMKKRQGSYLMNGFYSVTTDIWYSGSTTPPTIGPVNDWPSEAYRLYVGMPFKIYIWHPGHAHRYETLTFTIATLSANGDVTTTAGPAFNIPTGALVMALPYTQDRRIGGIFQAKFRNGSQPLLLDTVHTTTGEFKLHLQGNRQAIPFDLYARIAKTTVLTTFVNNIGAFTSVDGLQVGDWVNFPAADAGKQNAKIRSVNSVTRVVTLDINTIVTPLPAAGAVVRFLPSSCPGRIEPSIPVGLGKMSASQMGNRTVMAIPGFSPLRYAHTESTTITTMSLSPPYTTFLTAKALPPANVGREVVISDLQDPDGVGQMHLRKITAISGVSVTVTPPLPWEMYPGSLVDVVAISRVGVRAPSHAPTVAAGAGAGTLTGYYSYRVTYLSQEGGAWVESEAHPQASVRVGTAAGAGTLFLTNIPVPLDPRVTKKRIYRTSSGGDGVWYYTGEVDPAVTTFTDTKNDVLLGVQLDEFINYPPYETMEVVVEWPHAQRLMGIAQVGDTVWAVVWSDGPSATLQQTKPESWPLDNFLFIGLDSGDRPKGIAAFFDSMLVFCQRSIWRIQGIPPDLVVEPVNFQQHDQSGIGIESHQSLVVDQNEVVFPGPDGVYMIDRYGGSGTSGFQSQRISRQIDRVFDETYSQRRNRIHAVFVRNRRQYRLFWPGGSSDGEPIEAHIYQFDADQGGKPHFWSNWQFYPGVDQDRAKVSCSTVARPEPGDAFIFASRSECCFVGTLDGAVLGLDMVYHPDSGSGFIDYGSFPFPMTYRTMPFGPAGGLAAPTLGRFLHLALELVGGVANNLTLPGDLIVRVMARGNPLEEGENPSARPPPNAVFMLDGTASVTGVTLQRLVLLCRGQYHQIELDDRTVTPTTGISSGSDRLVALHRMTYFYQRLPETMVPETYVQAEPAD